MSSPKRMTGKLLDAAYLDHEKCVAMLIDCGDKKYQPRIPRESIATFGDRTEEEISFEMNKYVETLKKIYTNKPITIVFDPSLSL